MKTLWIYWRFASKYKRELRVSLVALPVVVLVQNGLLPLLYSHIIDRLHQTHNQIPYLKWWLLLFLGLHFLVFVGQRLVSRFWSKLEHGTIKDIEQFIFSLLIQQSSQFHNSTHAGSLVAQAKRFTGAFSNLMGAFFNNIYALILRIAIAFGFLIFIAPFIAFALLLWTVAYMVSIYLLTKRKMHASEAAAAADTKMTAHLADAIGNAPAIKIFGSEKMEGSAYADLSFNKYSKRRRDWFLSELILAWQGLLMIALESVVLVFSIQMVQNGSFSLGKLALIQFFLAPIMVSLWQIANIFRQVETSFSDASEMTRTLSVKPAIKDPILPLEKRIAKGEIEFRDVCFRYGDGKKSRVLFSDFDLRIMAGEKIGLVGPSGSGKTSLTKLLLRFMDLERGQILIDGVDITELRQADLRSQIAFVPQEPQLFHRTVKENIRYAKPDAKDEEIIAAAKMARAHDFIEKMPDGYHTMVGERGAKLSGGERQRIAIARAMLKDAPIVVLDEATSALDSESEKLVQEAFEELIQDRTAIVIAHRLSTVQTMDRIAVLKNGEIVEDGDHEGLLSLRGIYARLWQHQAGGMIR